MATTVTVQHIDDLQKRFLVTGFITLSASYGTGGSHGDVVNFISVSGTSQPPTFVQLQEIPVAGGSGTGFNFSFVPGTTISNGLLHIMTAAAAPGALVGGIEFTPGAAYSTATPTLVGTKIQFIAAFPKFI